MMRGSGHMMRGAGVSPAPRRGLEARAPAAAEKSTWSHLARVPLIAKIFAAHVARRHPLAILGGFDRACARAHSRAPRSDAAASSRRKSMAELANATLFQDLKVFGHRVFEFTSKLEGNATLAPLAERLR